MATQLQSIRSALIFFTSFAFLFCTSIVVSIDVLIADEPVPLKQSDALRFMSGLIRTIHEKHIEAPDLNDISSKLVFYMAEHHSTSTISSAELAQIANSKVQAVEDVESNLKKLQLPDAFKPEFFSEMHRAVFEPLDGIGDWVSPREDRVEKQLMANQYVGVGIAIGSDDKIHRPVLQRVFEGGTADLAGMKAGEVIVSVDGKDTENQSLLNVVNWLRGPAETQVTIDVFDQELKSKRTLVVPRRVTPIPTVELQQISEQSNFALLKFGRIVASCVHELRVFDEKLQKSTKAIVLDLRSVQDNGLHFAHMLLDALLDSKPLGYVASKNAIRAIESEDGRLFVGKKLIVVVSPNSSNCAQWIAQQLGANGVQVIFDSLNKLNRYGPYPDAAARTRVAYAHELVGLPNNGGSVWLATTKILDGNREPLLVVSRNPESQEQEANHLQESDDGLESYLTQKNSDTSQ